MMRRIITTNNERYSTLKDTRSMLSHPWDQLFFVVFPLGTLHGDTFRKLNARLLETEPRVTQKGVQNIFHG